MSRARKNSTKVNQHRRLARTMSATESARTATLTSQPLLFSGYEGNDHHGTHQNLLSGNTPVILETEGSTRFSNIMACGETSSKSMFLFRAAAQLVAVSVRPKEGTSCWTYNTYSLLHSGANKPPVPDDINLENQSRWRKRNTLHTRLDRGSMGGHIAALGAAAAFVSMQVEIGSLALPEVSTAGEVNMRNRRIHACLFAPDDGGSPVAMAVAHLRKDTTSILAFPGSSTDAMEAELRQRNMMPGDPGAHNCYPLAEFFDLSIYDTGKTTIGIIGQVLTRSFCEYSNTEQLTSSTH